MPPPNPHLHVSNLPPATSTADLHALFLPYGPLTDVHVPAAPAGPRYAFVSFDHPADAQQALLNLHHAMFHGRTLRVVHATSSRRDLLVEQLSTAAEPEPEPQSKPKSP